MPVIVIENDEEFAAKMAENKDKFIFVNFLAIWAGSCRVISRFIESISEQSSSIIFLQVDVDVCKEAAAGITGIPLFRVYRNGEIFEEFGGSNEAKIRTVVNRYDS